MCGYGLVGRDRRARPKVSPMGLMKGNIPDTHKCLCVAAVPFSGSMLGTQASERKICEVGADMVECHSWSRVMGCGRG